MKLYARRLPPLHATTVASVIALMAYSVPVAGGDHGGALGHIDTEATLDADIPAHIETVLGRVGVEIVAEERRMDGDIVVLQNVRVIETRTESEELWIDEIGIAQYEDAAHSGLIATRPDGDVRGKLIDHATGETHYFALNADGAELSLRTESDEHLAVALPADLVRFSGGSVDNVFHGAEDASGFAALLEDFALDFETSARSLDLGVSASAARIDRTTDAQSMTMAMEAFSIAAVNDGLDQDTDILFDMEALQDGATLELASYAENITTEQRAGDDVARSSMARAELDAFYGMEKLSLALETTGLDADGGVALGFLHQMLGDPDSDGSADLSLTTDRQRIAFSLPALPGEDAQDISLELLLEQVTPSADVWAMIDPQGALDHDPLNLALNLNGTAVATQHIVSAVGSTVGAVFMEGSPEQQLLGAVDRLDVALDGRLQALGARILLDADMTFDAGDMLPHLISTITMTGVEDTLASISAIPFVDEAAVMGATEALEMFTMPTDDGGRVMEFEGRSDGSAVLNDNPM
ncbi:MAG: hypothetical protein JJU09_02255 [Rhodobacteraceae bacterium]|nr:hypothetical protein [Paracoccaceae bacterium]